nr:MAG TPA: hypothetical protein [Caudoviricetes sp.]
MPNCVLWRMLCIVSPLSKLPDSLPGRMVPSSARRSSATVPRCWANRLPG